MIIPIRVSYRYTNYPNSKLATMVDKFCHSPSRILIMVVACILSAYCMICIDSLPVPEAVNDVLSNVCIAWIILSMAVVPFTGLLCRKLQLSRRIAEWDIRRQFTGEKLGKKFWIPVIALVLVLALPGVAALTYATIENSKALDYDNTMQVLSTDEAPAATGSAVVAYYEDDNRYARDVIPEALQAETPEAVRYILTLESGSELVGIYEDSFVGAYQRYYQVFLTDRTTGECLSAEIFYGGNPPYSIDSDAKSDQYGSWPEPEVISGWLNSLFEL